ncbi:MAG TPA: hypothetical protein VF659_06390 [Pyrinomonadaceae bacterium]
MATNITQKVDEILDNVDNLNVLCEMFFVQKKFTIYKSIAAALRLLLTGSSGDLGLVQDVLPNSRFSPLAERPISGMAADHISLPANMSLIHESGATMITFGASSAFCIMSGPKGVVQLVSFHDIFDSTAASIPIANWLDQPFLRPERTLFDFIKTIGNKDGVAHFNPNTDIVVLQKSGYLHWHLIAEIARAVGPQIVDQLNTAFPTHVRAVR